MQLKAIIPAILLLALVILVSVFKAEISSLNPSQEATRTKICLDGKACLEQAELTTQFTPNPIVIEEEINAKLFLSPEWKLNKGWIEGVNMYMGKSPLIIQENESLNGEYDAIFFLGSCSEPNMHWRMVTEWQHKTSNQTVTALYDFYTFQ